MPTIAPLKENEIEVSPEYDSFLKDDRTFPNSIFYIGDEDFDFIKGQRRDPLSEFEQYYLNITRSLVSQEELKDSYQEAAETITSINEKI